MKGEKTFGINTSNDIGCGVLVLKTNLQITNICSNKKKIKKLLQQNIPYGIGKTREKNYLFYPIFCNANMSNVLRNNLNKGITQLGTLGGGEHFISILVDGYNFIRLAVHTGSRMLGYKISNYYKNIFGGERYLNVDFFQKEFERKLKNKILCEQNLEQYKNKEKEYIVERIRQSSYSKDNFKEEKLYKIQNSIFKEDYINDFKFCREFAKINRFLILLETYKLILELLNIKYSKNEIAKEIILNGIDELHSTDNSAKIILLGKKAGIQIKTSQSSFHQLKSIINING